MLTESLSRDQILITVSSDSTFYACDGLNKTGRAMRSRADQARSGWPISLGDSVVCCNPIGSMTSEVDRLRKSIPAII